MAPVPGADVGAAISIGEVPLATRRADHRMQGVVVVVVLEPGQEYLALVDGRVEYGIAIDVRVDDDRRRRREHDPVVEDSNAERGVADVFLGHEDVR